ncbi:MAG: hypothetical protein P4L70_11745 [Parasulfuritortus sp.]|nr:hypothetical protein [Parasulfuritortus sp.]
MRNFGKTLIVAAIVALTASSAMAFDRPGNPPGPVGGPGADQRGEHPMAKHAVVHHRHHRFHHHRHHLNRVNHLGPVGGPGHGPGMQR